MRKILALAGIVLLLGFLQPSCVNLADDHARLPVLGGTVNVVGDGQTLTAVIGGFDGGADGVSFQWRRVAQGRGVNVGGNSGIYALQPGDAGSDIFVAVTRAGFSNAIKSAPFRVGGGDGDFFIRYEDLLGGEIGRVTISTVGDDPREIKITLLEPWRYDDLGIRWYLGEIRLAGDGVVSGDYGETLTVNPGTFGYGIGVHIVTLRVRMDDVPYSALISVEVRG